MAAGSHGAGRGFFDAARVSGEIVTENPQTRLKVVEEGFIQLLEGALQHISQ